MERRVVDGVGRGSRASSREPLGSPRAARSPLQRPLPPETTRNHQKHGCLVSYGPLALLANCPRGVKYGVGTRLLLPLRSMSGFGVSEAGASATQRVHRHQHRPGGRGTPPMTASHAKFQRQRCSGRAATVGGSIRRSTPRGPFSADLSLIEAPGLRTGFGGTLL